MKRRWSIRIMALIVALLLSALGIAEEATEAVGEIGNATLYELVLQAGESAPGAVPNEVVSEESAPEAVPNEVVPEEPAAEPEIPEAQLPLTEEEPASPEEPSAPGEEPADPAAPESSSPIVAGDGLTLAESEDVPEVSAPEAGASQPGELTLGAAKLVLGKGERQLLTASLSGGDASEIRFVSSKKGVVSVDATGMLYARKTGTAVITVQSASGAVAKCKVKVVNAPSKVTLSAKKLVLCEGEKGALKAKLPSGSASLVLWASSDPAVVTVDDSGNLVGVAPGTAVVRAMTFNGKKADCAVMVLAGSAPTSLSAGVDALTLGVKEQYQLKPVLGAGENTLFTYATSDKAVVTVSSAGVVTAKKAGNCKLSVATHNGLKVVIKVKVAQAPSRVTLSRSSLSMKVGETAALSAWVPSGTASMFTWSSSDPAVATVDGSGNITALKAGEVKIGVKTYNKKTCTCAVTVTEDGPSAEDDPGEDTSVDDGTTEDDKTTLSIKKMVANLRACKSLGVKADAIANVAELMMRKGFEPAFAAGVGANIMAEGNYGMFESSRYVTYPKKRPRYFCYLDGGEYYSSGNLVAVYMSAGEMKTYTGKAEARLRFDAENYYLDNWSKKYVQDINLTELEAFIARLDAGGWEGKFGLGIVQWTGGRTKTLVSFYRKHAGEGDAITAAQVAAAENEMILYDFLGDYKGVYNSWYNSNKSNLNCEESARSAGSIICLKYEIPVDKEEKARQRGSRAKEIFRIMVGEQ